MLRYHPERFRVTRPYAKQIVNFFRSNISDGIPSMVHLQELSGMIMKKYNEELMKLPFEKRPPDTRQLSKEISYAVQYATFVMYGRNIFHFEPDLTEKFRQTDVDEVPVSALIYPYKVFYMSFGIQEDLDLWHQGYYVDGAYIAALPGLPLQIILSTVRKDVDYKDKTNWITNPDRYYYLALNIDNPEASISFVVDQALEEEIKSHDVSHLPDESGVYEIDGQNIMMIDNKHNSAELDISDAKQGFNVFKEALRLVINGLCYVTSYREEIKEQWPDETPKLLLERLTNATKNSSRQKIRAELTSLGYTKVNFCGRTISKDKVELISSGKEISAHWRRGHWRNQAYGQGLKDRKLIWIMPVLVRKDKGEPELGHIYKP
ncbi:MAG: DUF386 domain-containing protein [Peptococcaceae bacterium]|nr:DUF386 domain-containing protein [Peptococcaceae bacterium]